MRKGFFLTESEKNRISNLYGGNKLFLLEATEPPTDPTEVKAFMDWADKKDPNWVLLTTNPEKKGISKKSDGTPRKMYGNPNSGSYKRAWAASGETYTKEKGGGKEDPAVDPKSNEKWIYLSGNPYVKVTSTKGDIQKLLDAGTLDGKTLVYRKGITTTWTAIKSLPDYFDLVPDVPGGNDDKKDDDGSPAVPDQKDDGTAVTTDKTKAKADANTSVSSNYSAVNYQANKEGADPVNNYSPIQTPDISGFNQWYTSIFKLSPAKGTINNKDKDNITYTIDMGNGLTKTYNYDSKSKTWRLPQGQNDGIEIKAQEPEKKEDKPQTPEYVKPSERKTS